MLTYRQPPTPKGTHINNSSEQHNTSVKQSKKSLNPFTNSPKVDDAEISAQNTSKTRKEKKVGLPDQYSYRSQSTGLSVVNTSSSGLATTSPMVPGCGTPSVGTLPTSNKNANVLPKTPVQTKRKHDEDIKDGNGHPGSSQKRIKRRHSARGKSKISNANHVRKHSEPSRVATQPPPSSYTLRPPTPSRQCQQPMRTSPKPPRPARHGKHCSHRSESKRRSAPASFIAVHIPSQRQALDNSQHRVRRHQPVREVKVIQSIEHQVDPLNPSHTPYPWDDPLISDASHHRFPTHTDQHESGTHHFQESDDSFTPTDSGPVSEIEASPLKEKRKIQRKRHNVRNRHDNVPQAADCANHIDVFYRSSSPITRVKRELTAALDVALFQVSSNRTPGDSDDILQGTASDFHVAEVRTLRRQIAHLAKLLQEERIVAEANKQDRELWYERAKGLLDRIMPTRSITPQTLQELGPVNQPEESMGHIRRAGDVSSTKYPNSIRHIGISHLDTSSTFPMQHTSQFQRPSVQSTNLPFPPTCTQQSTSNGNPCGRATKRRQPREEGHSIQAQPHARSYPSAPPAVTRCASGHQPGDYSSPNTPHFPKRLRAHNTAISSVQFSTPSTPCNKRLHRGDRHSLHVDSLLPHTRESNPPNSQPLYGTPSYVIAEYTKGSIRSPIDQEKTANANPLSDTVAYAVSRENALAVDNKDTVEETIPNHENAKRTNARDKQRSCSKRRETGQTDRENLIVVQEQQCQNPEDRGDGQRETARRQAERTRPAMDNQENIDRSAEEDGKKDEVSRATSELPDLNILLQESLSVRTRTQPVVAKQSDQEALAQTSNLSIGSQGTDTDITTSSKPLPSPSTHGKRLSSTNPTQCPQFHQYIDREEPASKRPCHRNSNISKVNFKSHCAQQEDHNDQASTHDHRGEQGLPSEITASSSTQAKVRIPTGPKHRPTLSSRNDVRVQSRGLCSETSQLRVQRAINTSRPRNQQPHGKNQAPPNQPWNKHRLQREISMPRPNLQRWNQSCRCSELPDYFYERAHIKPSLSTWSWGKEEFLTHCKQIIECPGHLHITRETCREIYRTERSGFEEKLIQKGHLSEPEHNSETHLSVNGTLDKDVEKAYTFANGFLAESTGQEAHTQHTIQPDSCDHGTIPSYVWYRKDQPRPQSRQAPILPQSERELDRIIGATIAAKSDSQAIVKSSTAPVHNKDQHANIADKTEALVPNSATRSDTEQLPGNLPTPLCSSSAPQSNMTQAVRIEDGINNTSSPSLVGLSKKTSLLPTPPPGKPQKPVNRAGPSPDSAKKSKKRKHVNNERMPSGFKSHDPAETSGKAPVGGQQCSTTTHVRNQSGNRKDTDGQAPNDSFNLSQSIPQQPHQSNTHDHGSWRHPTLHNGDEDFGSEQPARSILDNVIVIPRETQHDQVPIGQRSSRDRARSERSSDSQADGHDPAIDNPRRLCSTTSPSHRKKNPQRKVSKESAVVRNDLPNLMCRMGNPSPQRASKPRNDHLSTLATPRTHHSKATADEAAAPKPYDSSIYRRHDTEPVRSPELTSPATAVKRATAKTSRLPLFSSNLATMSQQKEPLSHTSASALQIKQSRSTNPVVGERRSKKLSVEEQQLRRPRLDRYVPHDERTSNQELIKIGRYARRYDRHISAPYAFRWDGKLFSEYRYLVNKTDEDGEGWNKMVRKRLT
ncbi:MAG: hypothetical protein Q9225_003170 [Loekoesia sp. 1 TL-2023]